MSAMDHSIREQMARSLVEVTAKWFCNALSTGAHVLIGKVCQNLMVDVNVRSEQTHNSRLVMYTLHVYLPLDIG